MHLQAPTALLQEAAFWNHAIMISKNGQSRMPDFASFLRCEIPKIQSFDWPNRKGGNTLLLENGN